MTFNDIFKSSFLESVSEFSLLDTLIGLSAALVIGIFIFLIYKKTLTGVMYSTGFALTLVGLSLVTTLVIMAVTSNVVLSLGMVGALSIVRFRTAIKDSRDTIYIFWAIVVGICCGAGDYMVAGVGSAFVFLVLLVFGRIRNDARVLLILRCARVDEQKMEALIFQYYSRRATLRSKNTTPETVEFIYELSGKYIKRAESAAGRSITDVVYDTGKVDYFNIVMQSDDISG